MGSFGYASDKVARRLDLDKLTHHLSKIGISKEDVKGLVPEMGSNTAYVTGAPSGTGTESKSHKYSLLFFSIPSIATAAIESIVLDLAHKVAPYVIQEGESLSWPGKGWQLGTELLGKVILYPMSGGIAKSSSSGLQPQIPELTNADKLIYNSIQSGSGDLILSAALIALLMGAIGFGIYRGYKRLTREG